MRIDRDTFEEIIRTLTQNKSRSLLTAFGVFWGIFMLIMLLGGGNGFKAMMYSNFDGFATNSCFAYSQRTTIPYKGFRKGRWWDLTTDDLENIKKNIPEIEHISAMNATWNSSPVYKDKKFNDGNIKGVLANYHYIEDADLIYGRFINEIDIRECRKVCVIGKNVYNAFFEKGTDPCGERIKVNSIYYTIIGVDVRESNISINGSSSDAITIPLTTMQKSYNQGNELGIICFTSKPGHKISEIEDKVKQIIYSSHQIAPTDPDALGLLNAEEMFSIVDNLFIGIDILLWLVGLGTLLAGIIGVSNIMMVTVKERTVEIGIRRAIGAQPKDIMQQILAESLILTLIAGMFGICAGVGILNIFDSTQVDDFGRSYGFQTTFGVAVGVCILIAALGAVAGLAPALRAMKIKPVEAMREE